MARNYKKTFLHGIAAIMETPQYRISIALLFLCLVSFIWAMPFASPTNIINEEFQVSYNELKAFLAVDRTDEREHIKDVWNCVNFTDTLLENASKFGIIGHFVVVDFGNNDATTHAIAMFNTDKGFIYIEPQNDKELDPEMFEILYIYQWE